MMQKIICLLTITILVLVVQGCIGIKEKKDEQNQYLTFRYAPNIQYLTSFGSEHDINPPLQVDADSIWERY